MTRHTWCMPEFFPYRYFVSNLVTPYIICTGGLCFQTPDYEAEVFCYSACASGRANIILCSSFQTYLAILFGMQTVTHQACSLIMF